ncbi:MAG: choice-of-anchor D domain-containing protein, partial [Bacteroidota bacterium]
VLTPANVEFGEVQIGKASRKTVIITNPNTPGGAPVTISSIAIVPASSSITIIQPTIPPARTLAPGDTLRVTIEYTPGASGKLPRTAMAIVVAAPCADSSRYAITGSGTNADIGVSRTEITFSIAACTEPNWVDDSLVVFNAGTSPIDITNITTAGDGIFTLLSPIPSKFTLPPGGTRPVHVRYSAFDAGESSGTLDFTTTDPNRETFEVDLRGVLDSVNIVPATRHLILPQIFSCRKSSKGKLWLRNIGTALATLDAVYITSPYSFAPPAKTPIPPGDSIAVDLTFAPIADGVYSAWLIYEISPCNIRDSVLVTAERSSARYDITNVDFGLVSVGGSTAGSATLTNRNSVGIWITDAQIAPANGTITIDPGQIPQFIAAGASTQIGLLFIPTAIGDIPPGIKLVITADSTCPSTLEAGITGTGTAGGIDVSPLSVQFKPLLRCQDARDTLFIRNIGTAPLMVQHMDVSTQDLTAVFAILDGPTPSTSIPAGGSDTIIIRFVPRNGPDASITGLLTLYTNDPINPPVKISLFGSRISQRLALAGPLFAQVEAGKTGSSTRWIVNTGSAPVTINGLSIGAPFAVSGSRPGLPVTLAPGDSLETDITFSPLTPGD